MKRVLWMGRQRMLKLGESLLDVARHRAINGVSIIVPLESHAKVQTASPIFSDGVEGPVSVDEVFCMFTSNIFDTSQSHQ